MYLKTFGKNTLFLKNIFLAKKLSLDSTENSIVELELNICTHPLLSV